MSITHKTQIADAHAMIGHTAEGRPTVTIYSKHRGMVCHKTLGEYEHIATTLSEMIRDHGFRMISTEIEILADSLSVGYYELKEVE